MNFAQLRRLVSIEQVLSHRGLLDGLRRRGHRLVGPCPVHGGDNPDAFVVDCRRDLWNCFTVCHGGDLIELVRRLDNATYAEVARTLHQLVGQPQAPPPTTPPSAASFRPYTRRLTLDPHHPFLHSRRIHAATARRFEVGAWHGRGMLAGCLAVRLHDPSGRPLGYAGRRLQPTARGKWVFPPRLPKSRLLYGWHHTAPCDDLVIVEGPWEVLRLHQLGVPAVALLGTNISLDQIRLLGHTRCAVLLDGDPPGQRAAQRIARQLEARILQPPPGHDPADLHDRQLAAILNPLLS